ncbi:MAG: hypothetical protein PHF51_05610 [Candidatus ainarchaeum sp.]|nr:hypothetical protein [Candidatus ainarchaeum sp.]
MCAIKAAPEKTLSVRGVEYKVSKTTDGQFTASLKSDSATATFSPDASSVKLNFLLKSAHSTDSWPVKATVSGGKTDFSFTDKPRSQEAEISVGGSGEISVRVKSPIHETRAVLNAEKMEAVRKWTEFMGSARWPEGVPSGSMDKRLLKSTAETFNEVNAAVKEKLEELKRVTDSAEFRQWASPSR